MHAKGVSPPMLVREGFSFLAFLFSAPWFLVNRMWLVLVLYLACVSIVGTLTAGLPREVTFPIMLAGQILIGFHARDLLRWTLRRRGWKTLGIVAAQGGEDAALARLYAARPELLAWVKAA